MSENTTHRLPVLDPDEQPVPPPERSSGRFWSARRVPAALVALCLIGGAGLLLYDVAAVRAGHPAMYWRRELARQLAEQRVDAIPVLAGAAFVAAVGLWLLFLALTPGLRRLLPMSRPHPDVRAALRREAAAVLLRDRAMDISGVREAHVRVGRRKADVKVVSHFREPEEVREDLDTTLDGAVRELGLSRPPKLSVRVRRPGKKE
ncbi:DUF6286 domain-containing protein [Streptomyces sp. NPDC059597]|uniref:DUF6286 domain-containing protein n=1 Tax=Streptomyces sp. NPDC059597 TaxID=3346879 RepID=UPI0036B053FB